MKVRADIERLCTWYDERTLRERGVLLICLLIVLYFLVDMLLLTPMANRIRAQHSAAEKSRYHLIELQAVAQQIEARKSFDPDREERVRLAALNAEYDRLQSQLRENVVKLIAPREMPALLKELLLRQHKLQLFSLENFPAEELKIGDAAADEKQVPHLYRHRLRMEFGGDYLSTLAYLRKLGELPRNLMWDELEIETMEYPQARVRFEVFTLSLEPGWIGG